MNYRNRIAYDGIKNHFHSSNSKKEDIGLVHHVPSESREKWTQTQHEPSSELDKDSLISDLQGVTIINILNIKLWAQIPKRGDKLFTMTIITYIWPLQSQHLALHFDLIFVPCTGYVTYKHWSRWSWFMWCLRKSLTQMCSTISEQLQLKYSSVFNNRNVTVPWHKTNRRNERFGVLKVVTMKITVTWDVTPCTLIDGYQRSFTMLVPTYQTTRLTHHKRK
jgi:hypothetical protein